MVFILNVGFKTLTGQACATVNGWPNGFAFILSLIYPLWSIGS